MICPKCYEKKRDCVCGSDPEPCSGPAALVADYMKAVAKLDAYRVMTFRRGCFVKVDCDRYRGFGFLCISGDCPPHNLAVRLENGNTWWYPMDSVTRVTDLRSVPRSVRRSKLRWSGYKLTGCTR